MDARACKKSDIKNLEETKFYTSYANGIIEALVKAVQSKNIKPLSALVWIVLKMEVNLRSDDWSIKKSLRALMSQFGIAKSTAQAVVNELSEQGFFIKENNRREDNSQDAMTLKVRFPETGIHFAELAPNRSKKEKRGQDAGSHNLSPEVYRNSAQGCTENQTAIKNTRNKTLENNKGAELPTEVTETSLPETKDDFVDCCLPQAVEDKQPNPVINAVEESESPTHELDKLKVKLVKLQADEKLLAQQYAEEPGNLAIYHKLSSCRLVIEQTLFKIEHKHKQQQALKESLVTKISAQQVASGNSVPTGDSSNDNGRKRFIRRKQEIVLPDHINKHIDAGLRRASKDCGISGISTYAERIKMQLSNFRFGNEQVEDDLKHAANCLISMLRKGLEVKPPGGCSDITAIDQREKEAKLRKQAEIKASQDLSAQMVVMPDLTDSIRLH